MWGFGDSALPLILVMHLTAFLTLSSLARYINTITWHSN